MPNLDKILKNYEEKEVSTNFFLLHEKNKLWLEGWVHLDDSLEKFLSFIESEMKYSWERNDLKISDYQIFQIDMEDKNQLIEIKTESQYGQTRKQDDIYIVILSKESKYRLIENIPLLFEWFQRILNQD